MLKITPDLIVLCGLVTGAVDVRSISPDQWVNLVQLARVHGLAPLLIRVLKQSGINLQDDPIWQSLVQYMYQNMARAAMLEKSFQDLIAILYKAQILSIWLKGAALATTVYGDWSLRPMSDLDVLVPYERRDEALRVVQQHSYDFNHSEQNLFGAQESLSAHNHHYQLIGGAGGNAYLELHYWLLGRDHSHLLPLDGLNWFLDQTETVDRYGYPLLILKPEAHFLYLCAHALLQHSEDDFYALRFLDLHELVKHYRLDWEIIVKKAVELKWTYAVKRALKITVQLYATQIPETVLKDLMSSENDESSTRYAMMLSGKGSRGERLWSDIQQIKWKNLPAFVYRVLFPSRIYMKHRYQIPSHNPVFPYYFYRWFDQARQVFWMVLERTRYSMRHSMRTKHPQSDWNSR